MIRRWLLASISGLAFAVAAAGPAAADPAGLIITALGGAATIGTAGVIAVQLSVGLALSYVSQAMMSRKARENSPGLRTETTTEGGTLPQTRILGRYATSGNVMAPFYSHGVADGIENGYRYAVFDLADHPVEQLLRFWVDGTRFSPGSNLDGGDLTVGAGAYPTEAVAGNDPWVHVADGVEWPQVRCRFFDGRQTTAATIMTDRFDDHPERPWGANMIGKGVAYAVMVYRYDPELYRGEPQVRWELLGERLYDRRLDSSAGGSGTHRAADPATWQHARNPMQMVANILAGLPLTEGGVWGMGVEQEDMPLAPWAEAMNNCDEITPYGKRFEAGYEIRMATADRGGDTPLDVIDELLKACSGAVADCGGTWLARCGPPGASVFSITDADLLAEEPQEFTIHEGVTKVYNTARVSHPLPDQMWEASEAPLFTDAAALAQDGEMLVADLNLPAVFSRPQAKALARAYVRDSRRFRRHSITLPPWFSNLQPLDAITWNSQRHGYEHKKFEVFEVAHDPLTLCVTAAIRERSPADYDWSADDLSDDPGPSAGVNRPQYLPLPGFDAQAAAIEDADGTDKEPAIRLVWSKNVESRVIEYEGRRMGSSTTKIRGTTRGVADGEHFIRAGIRPGVGYTFRARGLNPRTGWSDWDPVTAHDLGVAAGDIRGGVVVYDRSFVRFRRGPMAQNLQTAGWRSDSDAVWTRIGAVVVRRTAGGATRFSLSFRAAAWADDSLAQVRLVRRLPDASLRHVDSCFARIARRGAWVDVSRIMLDEDRGGNPVGQTGLQTTYYLEVRRPPSSPSDAAVRVNAINVSAENYRVQ